MLLKFRCLKLGDKVNCDGRFCYRFFKRAFDIFFSIIGIVITSPILLVFSFIIKFSDFGPVIYKSGRVGFKGTPLTVYKFRSMRVGSDNIENFLSGKELDEFKNEFKLKDDCRVTKIGKFIRKTSIDELPQFFNVLIGNMSMVGPRPITEAELKKYGDDAELLLSVKPGITGMWQCSGRNKITYADGKRQATELYYVKNQSFILDIKIIFKTLISVFKYNEVL